MDFFLNELKNSLRVRREQLILFSTERLSFDIKKIVSIKENITCCKHKVT